MPCVKRLSNSMFVRPNENANESPKRIIFLSVEGNRTEIDYFTFVKEYRERLGVSSLVWIEPIHRRDDDTMSDPNHVLELLQECMTIKRKGILPEEIKKEISKFGKFELKDIKEYLDGKSDEKQTWRIETALRLAGIDIAYQKYLCDVSTDNTEDIFGIVLDRDKGSHSGELLYELIKRCEDDKLLFLITNPCFEFWLLLHICDVSKEYKDKILTIQENKKCNGNLTFVGDELRKRTGIDKAITGKDFEKYFLNNVDLAIDRSKQFERDSKGILKTIGTNIPMVFDLLREVH